MFNQSLLPKIEDPKRGATILGYVKQVALGTLGSTAAAAVLIMILSAVVPENFLRPLEEPYFLLPIVSGALCAWFVKRRMPYGQETRSG
jgi:hypothetical protein